MDIYYEQYVINDNPKRNRAKKITLRVFYYLAVVSIFVSVMLLYLGLLTPVEEGSSFPFAVFIFPLFMLAASVSLFFFVRKKLITVDEDYDYLLNNETLTIVKVYNKMRRKKFISVNVKNFQVLGKISDEKSNRYFSMPQVKKVIASMAEDVENIYFAFFTEGTEKTLLVFDPDEKMLISLRRVIGRNINL